MADFPTTMGQPRTLKAGDTAVVLHPLTVGDFAAWDAWARSDFLAGMQLQAKTIDDPTERRQFMSAAMDAAGRINLGSIRALGQMVSITGKLRVVLLSMQHAKDGPKTPDEAFAAVAALAGGTLSPLAFSKLNEAWTEAMKASGLIPEGETSADPTKLAVDIADLTT